MLSSVLVLVPFLGGIHALNDWSVPCISGECSYDLPSTNSSGTGSVKIWGSTAAITDITNAADWQILGCDSNALAQDIRLVCMNDPDDPNSKCSHLYADNGAVNKLVRLPENCGGSAFARIAKAWVPDDQSIPTSVRRGLVRRDGKQPVVKALKLDTDFDAVDWSKNGQVNIAILAANVPGVSTNVQIPSKSRRWSRKNDRRFSIGDALGSIKDGIDNAADKVKDAAGAVGDKVKDVAGDVKDAASDAADKAKDAAKDVASKAKDAATKAADAAKNAATKVAEKAKDAAGDVADAAKSVANNTIDASKTFQLKPLTFNKNVNLVNSDITCGKVSASLQVDMDANANAQVSMQVAATGTIAPPKLTSFGVVAGMTANVAGTLSMTADITGHVDSGKIQLVNLGIPGFDFPGILTVGPSFTVSAQVVGDVDVVMDMTAGINFDVNNAQLAFPPDDKNKPVSSAFSIGDTPLTLNAAPDVTATGTLTAHLIPSLNLGVSALGNKAKAQIFLNLDTNAALTMNLDGSASATKVVTPPAPAVGSGAEAADTAEPDAEVADDSAVTGDDAAATEDDAAAAEDTTDEATADDATEGTDETADATDGETEDGTDDTEADADTATTDDAATDDTAEATDDTATTDDSAAATNGVDVTKSFGGCINLNGAITVNAGAEGSFFGLFDKVKQAQLFNKNFKIFTATGAAAATDDTAAATTDDAAATPAKRSSSVSSSSLERRVSLTCPLAGSTKKQGVTKGTVKSADIKST
ncbi:hypothetical protein R3P38DRAFT_3306393 [Favolaschia claudopus]|uniref:Uncharacterized protein n=1 Tax=Favolaschia claudopus TaxID=2862362 RepID=A0AAW0DBR2_9AGAR